MNNATTTNLSDFGYRELDMLQELLKAMKEQGLPEGFDNSEVVPMMNRNSGNVFLTNSEYQVAMLNGNDLEIWYFTPYEGHEGFADELKEMYDNGEITNEEDIEYLVENGIIEQPEEDEE